MPRDLLEGLDTQPRDLLEGINPPSQSVIPEFLRKTFQSYTQPTDIVSGVAPYKAMRAINEQIAQYHVPAMQKVPIVKDIPFGARLTGDPNAIFDLMAGRQALSEKVPQQIVQATLPRTVKNLINPTGLAQRFRNTIWGLKRQASEKFGNQLDELVKANPERTISLSPIVEELKTEAIDNPKILSIINRVPSLKQAMSKPEVTVKEAQNIINGIKGTLPPAKLQGFNVRPQDIPLFDLVDNIKTAQLDVFPEMANIRADYGNILNKYNLVKNQLKVGKTEGALSNKFGSKEIWGEMQKVLPPEIRNEIGKYATATSMGKIAKRFLPYILIEEGIRRGLSPK